MRELLNDVAILCGQGFAHLRSGILLTNSLEYLDELIKRDLIPIMVDRSLLAEVL